jgi:osmotically-inducible protein OsmY
VQLTGFVNSNDEKSRAADLARNVNGVVDVKNDLEIRQN